MEEPGMAVLVLVLGFTISCLAGFLGIGGGIVMAPALLYLPTLLGLGTLEMREVTGLTITQGLFAGLSGAIRHDRYRSVHRGLVAWMGTCIAISALAGAIISRSIANEILMVLFAALALIAAGIMLFPRDDAETAPETGEIVVNLPLAVLIALVIGILGGMVGQGGSFILIPLMLYVLKLPLRVVIGSNLALAFLASLAGFVGKLATGQIPLLPAMLLVVGAVPGAQIGGILSHRASPRWLRTVLAVVVAAAAVVIAVDVYRLS